MATGNGTNFFSDVNATLSIALTDPDGLAVFAKCVGAAPTTANVFAHGCVIIRTDSGLGVPAIYQNIGSAAAPSWSLVDVAGAIGALTDAHIFVGSALNVATDVAVTGDIGITNAGVTSIAAGVIVNADINAAAAIDFAKLATLSSGNILVGSAGGVATSVALSGDATLAASGAMTIGNGAITKVKLASGVSASNMCVLAGSFTTVGGDANEAIVDASILGTDLAIVMVQTAGGTPRSIVSAACAAGQINVVLSGDPSNDHILSYFVFRATT